MRVDALDGEKHGRSSIRAYSAAGPTSAAQRHQHFARHLADLEMELDVPGRAFWTGNFEPARMTALGPKLPTLALQQVGSYLGHTGHAANVIARAACATVQLEL